MEKDSAEMLRVFRRVRRRCSGYREKQGRDALGIQEELLIVILINPGDR